MSIYCMDEWMDGWMVGAITTTLTGEDSYCMILETPKLLSVISFLNVLFLKYLWMATAIDMRWYQMPI